MGVEVCKFILVVINFIFLIIGLAFAAGGVILAFMPDVIMDSAYDQVKKEVDGLSSNDQFQIPASASDMKELPLGHELGIALFALGIVLFVIAFLGCCGACCKCCRLMLILFAIALLGLMVIEIVFFALFFQEDSAIHQEIKEKLTNKMSNPYDEQNPSSFDTMMNLINYNFECCGINGKNDYVVTQTTIPNSPLSCKDLTLPIKGCYEKLEDIVQDNLLYAGLVAGGLLLLQLVEVVFAIIIFKESAKVFPI